MLNRSLFFSVAAVLFLLILQGLWLYRIIDNEQKELKSRVISIIEESTKMELNSRIQAMMGRGGKSINIVLNQSSAKPIKSDSTQSKNRDISVYESKKNVSDLSMEEALQEMFKIVFPTLLRTLNSTLGPLPEQIGIVTSC